MQPVLVYQGCLASEGAHSAVFLYLQPELSVSTALCGGVCSKTLADLMQVFVNSSVCLVKNLPDQGSWMMTLISTLDDIFRRRR